MNVVAGACGWSARGCLSQWRFTWRRNRARLNPRPSDCAPGGHSRRESCRGLHRQTRSADFAGKTHTSSAPGLAQSLDGTERILGHPFCVTPGKGYPCAMTFLKHFAAGLLLAGSGLSCFAASAVHKCVINGTVTFQKDPCPSGAPRQDPTVERLNTEERKRREASPAKPNPSGPPTAQPQSDAAAPAVPVAPQAPSFRCDGRKYCSQMTSCEEAKYFLAHCPRVSMDGDRNGIPCERQWCSR